MDNEHPMGFEDMLSSIDKLASEAWDKHKSKLAAAEKGENVSDRESDVNLSKKTIHSMYLYFKSLDNYSKQQIRVIDAKFNCLDKILTYNIELDHHLLVAEMKGDYKNHEIEMERIAGEDTEENTSVGLIKRIVRYFKK